MRKADMYLLLALFVCRSAAYNLTCHCLNNLACDTNGFCANGCENGWHGPGCQFGNVALGKKTNQSTTHNQYGYVCSADRAVDGSWPIDNAPFSCSHTLPDSDNNYPQTANKGSAWWAVMLDEANYYFISNITIVNRRDQFASRLTNFKILYSNDTVNDPNPQYDTWQECARESGVVGDSHTYTCNNVAIAKRVAVYLTAYGSVNPKSILTLCEVQIYGYEYNVCPSGFTGPGCLLRSCEGQCDNNGEKCIGDFGSCHYDMCRDQWLLPPDCWITLGNFSELIIKSEATCNSLLFSAALQIESQANIAASSLQLQVTTSTDQQVQYIATLPLEMSFQAYHNFSDAVADTKYIVHAKLIYCDNTGSSCFHANGSQLITLMTGKRKYVFIRNSNCVSVIVTSETPYCEMPSLQQVTCDAENITGVTVNSSGWTTCGLARDQAYSCSITAFINVNVTERRSSYIVAEPLSTSPVPEENIAALAGGIGGSIALVVITVAIVAIVYLRRQLNAKEKADEVAIAPNADQSSRETADDGNENCLPSSINAGLSVDGDEGIYCNTSGMNLSKFQIYAQNEALIARRFSELQANELHPCIEGRSPENKGKNRFQNILPYDSNRIRLASSVDGYINASYINGFIRSNEFIAAQGPTLKTVVDFWHMIWQEKCSVIVMLTQYVENAKSKCEKYFPFSKSHGLDIEVTTRSSAVFDTHKVTVLEVAQGQEIRLVHHFHFLAWPDQSVPDHSSQMLLFYRQIGLHLKRHPSTGPVVVHCSAGVGRTGAYIAFDYLQQRYQSESTVDVDSCVVRLRDQRMLMVQTKEQYLFLHRVVLYGLRTIGYIYDAAQLPLLARNDAFSDSSGTIKKATEYEELQAVRPMCNELSFSAAVLPENRGKNRRSQILALDSKRPLLSRPDNGSPLYINAVYCNGCYSDRAFIVTQVPLRQTIEDFWLMVYECQPSCIILLHDLPTSDDEEDCACYWPEPGHCMTAGYFEVRCDVTGDESATNTRMPGRHIALCPVSCHMTASRTVSTKLFTTTLWNTKWSAELPANANDIIVVANALRTFCAQVPCQPIIVQCRDGVTQSGLFLSAVNALHRLIETEQVSVFHTVDLLRTSRPEFITSEAQYRFIYQILELYRNSSSTYVNS